MAQETPKYSKENAPKGIKVDMDYMSSPIWVSDPDMPDDSTPYTNADLSDFPFPPALNYLLYCYQEVWETVHNTKYIPLEELADTLGANPTIDTGINTCLEALSLACEELLDEWLKVNGWNTKLYIQNNLFEENNS